MNIACIYICISVFENLNDFEIFIMGRRITEDWNPEDKVSLSTLINLNYDIDADLKRYCTEIGLDYLETEAFLHKISVFIIFFKG